MDVERTIEFILRTQTKTEARLDTITKLLHQGMRSQAQKRGPMPGLRRAHALKLADVQLAKLAQAQKETQRSLKAFIDSLRQGRNGRQGR